MVTGRIWEHDIYTRRFTHMINQLNKQTEGLQLLSTVDPTSHLEYDLLDRQGAWQLEDEDKKDPGRNKANRRRLSFSLAVRKGRFARYSLLIGSRYGVWSTAERRFIKRTNFYHYHHITQGISDLRQVYSALLFDGFYDVCSLPGFLCKLFLRPRRAVQILRALLLYYHVFMAKDHHMECWPADVQGKDRREELRSLRHRLVDVYQRRMSMTPAQRQRILVIYESHSRDIRFGLGFFFLVPLVLFVFITWLLIYYW